MGIGDRSTEYQFISLSRREGVSIKGSKRGPLELSFKAHFGIR